MVAAAGMTIGSHTWSHKDLAKQSICQRHRTGQARNRDGRQRGAHGGRRPIAPFFRFPDLQQPPELIAYLGTRNIATFLDRHRHHDFKLTSRTP
jgi:peptidoglycan/xylan/chitin deacetylase (PgdA/CDA1 family)